MCSSDLGAELLVGIGIQLPGEAEQQALRPTHAASSQGYGQSLQVVDRSNPQSGAPREV